MADKNTFVGDAINKVFGKENVERFIDEKVFDIQKLGFSHEQLAKALLALQSGNPSAEQHKTIDHVQDQLDWALQVTGRPLNGYEGNVTSLKSAEAVIREAQRGLNDAGVSNAQLDFSKDGHVSGVEVEAALRHISPKRNPIERL